MKNKQEAKQLVRFPYCRIYRRFINHLEHDIRIRKHGQGILYRYIALFALANFRCGVRTLNGQRYVMQAGEWIASYQELCKRLCLHTQKQVINTLCRLEELGLIEAQVDSRHKLVRFKICCWPKTNTTFSYSAPCPKDMGFFFFPVKQLSVLIGTERCSEADMLLDLWLNTVFQDSQVPGSDLCPVVYFREEGPLPLISCAMLAARWQVSKATVHRVLQKFQSLGLLAASHRPGKQGSVIMLRGYLPMMFCMEDVLPAAQELFARLHPSLTECIPAPAYPAEQDTTTASLPDCWSDSVSKPDVPLILENLRNALFASGFRCSACPHALYRLSNLSGCKEEIPPYDLAIFCAASGMLYHFSLKLEPAIRYPDVEVEVI